MIIFAPISETTAEDRLGLGPESLAQDLDWDWVPRLKAGTGRDWALECRREGRDWHWESSVTGETLRIGINAPARVEMFRTRANKLAGACEG